MNYTLVMLTATWITAAPVDAPSDAKAQTTPAALAQAYPTPGEATPPEKPSLGTRLHNFFFGPRTEQPERPQVPVLEPREVHIAPKLDGTTAPVTVKDTKKAVVPAATVPVAKPAVVSATAPVQTVKPVVATTTVQTMRPNFDLAEKELKMVGHETDYSWITGKLVRAPGAGGHWMIRYSGPYEQDRYNGSLLLTGSAELAKFHEGDLVCVHGKVATSGRMMHATETAYDVQSINLIGRATR
jgi:hypothetical protein